MMGEVIRVSGRAPDVGDLLREAMLSQRFADVALCCSGGQRFLAHRLVLSAASPYLQDVLLAHGKAAGYGEPITIILAEVEGPELSAILGFVYTGSATIPKSRLEAFTRAAEMLQVALPSGSLASSVVSLDSGSYRVSKSEERFKVEVESESNIDNVNNPREYLSCEQYPPSCDFWSPKSSPWLKNAQNWDEESRDTGSIFENRTEERNREDSSRITETIFQENRKLFGYERNEIRAKYYEAKNSDFLETGHTMNCRLGDFRKIEPTTCNFQVRQILERVNIEANSRREDDNSSHNNRLLRSLDSFPRYEGDLIEDDLTGCQEMVPRENGKLTLTGHDGCESADRAPNSSDPKIVASEITIANSTRPGRDLCGESCCRWRTPRIRHVANRVPASPWCQLARPAHHSPKTRNNLVLRNRDEEIRSGQEWTDSSYSSVVYSENHRVNDFSSRENSCTYGFRVPRSTEEISRLDDRMVYPSSIQSPLIYEEKNYFPSAISAMENSILKSNDRSVDVECPSRLGLEETSNAIENREKLRISRHAISPDNNKRVMNDPSTCDPQTINRRIELSHPISRLCDSACKPNGEPVTGEPFFPDKNIPVPDIETNRDVDSLHFASKNTFATPGRTSQSDDNNNEPGIDNSIAQNIPNVETSAKVVEGKINTDDANTHEEHRCEQCGKTFVTRASLKVHGRTHSGEKPFRCNDCGKEFSQLRNYKYHRSVHEGTREFAATCPECGKYFNDRGYLSSHMKIHRNRKEYACGECGKSFNQRVAYNMHVRIHTGVKPHQCEQCGKAFSRKMLLKQHLRTHSGERPYQCQICHKAFADRSNMTLHTRLHSGLKPYQCTLCSKAFTKKHHLKTHLNYHTGTKPYSCPNCSLRFSQSSNMRTHYKKCCSVAEVDASALTRVKVEATPVESHVMTLIEVPSADRRTNPLTPPNSDQETSAQAPTNDAATLRISSLGKNATAPKLAEVYDSKTL